MQTLFFRTGFTRPQGLVDAQIVTARIIDTNLVTWTVDVRTQFDRHWFYGIQVGGPYLHYNRGEGIYAFPEVGAMCSVVIPSDSAPPFVSSFLMPHETIPTSTTEGGAAATFAGGRPRAKNGDICLRTRDGNFLTLHRGGVLQIGATELAQRIYLPLRNHVMDVSENFSHHNAGGTIRWGIQEGPSEDRPSEFVQTVRVFANDQYADVRISAGKVHSPMAEPTGDAGEATNLQKLEIGTDKNSPIIYEVVVAPKGFDTESGEPATDAVRKQTVLRYFFDRRGGTFLRCAGNVLLSCRQKLFVHVADELTIQGDKNMAVTAKTGIDMDGGSHTHIKGGVVRLGAGTKSAAREGDLVRMPFPLVLKFDGTISGSPATGLITSPQPLYGTILPGQKKVFV